MKKGTGDAVHPPSGKVRQQSDGGELHELHHVHVPEAAPVFPHQAVVILRQHGGVRHVQPPR